MHHELHTLCCVPFGKTWSVYMFERLATSIVTSVIRTMSDMTVNECKNRMHHDWHCLANYSNWQSFHGNSEKLAKLPVVAAGGHSYITCLNSPFRFWTFLALLDFHFCCHSVVGGRLGYTFQISFPPAPANLCIYLIYLYVHFSFTVLVYLTSTLAQMC